MLTATEGILELQIPLFALCIVSDLIIRCGLVSSIFQYFSTVGIDTHTYYATLAVVGVEGDTGLGAGGDIAHFDVVKEER